MKRHSGRVDRFVVFAAVVVTLGAFAGTLVLPARADGGVSITVRGAWLSSSWVVECGEVVDNQVTCTVTGGGPSYGGMRGTMSITAIGVATLTSPFLKQVGTGTMTCDPCTIGGHTGTVTFSVAWTGSNVGLTKGTMTVVAAGGDLAGLSGAGTWKSTSMALAQEYTLDLVI